MQKVILVLIVLLAGCGNQGDAGKKASENEDKKNILANVNISGQIFVITKGRENIKLALVNVVAIPEKEFVSHIKALQSSGRIEQRKALELEMHKTEKEAATALAAFRRTLSSDNRKVVISISAYWDLLLDKWDYFDAGGYLFEKLPASIADSKTDADGKFSFSLPPGRYVLAANSSRNVSDKVVERYYWLVWVNTSSSNHSVMLSNDNLFETKCNECVEPFHISVKQE